MLLEVNVNLTKILRSAQKLALEVELHHGVALAYATFPTWGKILFWVGSGGLALSGLLLARKLFRRGKRPVWVKVGKEIFKAKESKVTLVEVDDRR